MDLCLPSHLHAHNHKPLTLTHLHAHNYNPQTPKPPRYLLKLRAEVEVMQQLGVSLNAVHLQDVYEDDANVHMVMVRGWDGFGCDWTWEHCWLVRAGCTRTTQTSTWSW